MNLASTIKKNLLKEFLLGMHAAGKNFRLKSLDLLRKLAFLANEY
jgi:hypothetical protein